MRWGTVFHLQLLVGFCGGSNSNMHKNVNLQAHRYVSEQNLPNAHQIFSERGVEFVHHTVAFLRTLGRPFGILDFLSSSKKRFFKIIL